MEIVYYVGCSLDGFIAAPDGNVDWLSRFLVEGEDYGYGEFYDSVDVVLLGSRTYEDALQHGRWQAADKPSVVFTSRDLPVADASVSLTSDDPEQVVRSLEAAGYERAWLMGGGKLAASFRAQGLITRYMICYVPTLIGGGISLFADVPGMTELRFVDAKSYCTGAVMLTYAA